MIGVGDSAERTLSAMNNRMIERSCGLGTVSGRQEPDLAQRSEDGMERKSIRHQCW